MVENLKVNHSAIINGVVPEQVSYGRLSSICKGLIRRGDGMVYLPRVIEMLEELMRKNGNLSDDEMIDLIAGQLEIPNNKWVWLHDRAGDSCKDAGYV